MKRGEVWWAELDDPAGSAPGFRHPVVVISTNPFNDSRIATVIVAILTSNLRLAAAPGNVKVSPRDTGLPNDSVVNVSQVLTVDKRALVQCIGHLPADRSCDVDAGLRHVLGL